MSNLTSFHVEESALLIMDYQILVLENYLSESEATALVNQTKILLDQVRKTKMKIIYLMVEFQEGYPEVNAHNKVFAGVKKMGFLNKDDSKTKIHSLLEPLSEEVVISRNRVGAFSFNNLDLILRSNQINTLFVTGILTSGVVLSTTCQAADLDYQIHIIHDCCADSDREVHQMLMKKILTQHANIIDSIDLIKKLDIN
jgi:nicotinamidase-related amidase